MTRALVEGGRFLWGEIGPSPDMNQIRDIALKWRGVLHLLQEWDGAEEHVVPALAELQEQIADVLVPLENAIAAFDDIDEALDAVGRASRVEGEDAETDADEPEGEGWPTND